MKLCSFVLARSVNALMMGTPVKADRLQDREWKLYNTFAKLLWVFILTT